MAWMQDPAFCEWKNLAREKFGPQPNHGAERPTVYVDLFHFVEDYLVRSLHLGRIIGEETGCAVVALTGPVGVVRGQVAPLADLVEIASAFAIPVNVLPATHDYAAAVSWLAEVARAQDVNLTQGGGSALRRMLRDGRLEDGFPIGHYIYDSHLRHRLTETISNLNGPLIEDTAEALGFLDQLRHTMDRAPAAWWVTGHIDYSPFGLVAEEVLRRGGRVAFFRNEGLNRVHLVEGTPKLGQTILGRIRETHGPVQAARLTKFVTRARGEVEAHFRAVATGQLHRSVRFTRSPLAEVKTGHCLASAWLRELLDLPEQRHTVAIFPITYADIALADEQIFDDNFQWLKETLAFAASRPDVSWIVKAHPLDGAYNVTRATERLIERHSATANIRFVDETWSPLMAIMAADVVTTIRGSPGLQAAMVGRQVIFAGRGHFSDYNFGLVPDTPQEYFEALVNQSDGGTPPSDGMLRARAYQYDEDVESGLASSLLPSFGAIAMTPDPWRAMIDRLIWFSAGTDPLTNGVRQALRNGKTRVMFGPRPGPSCASYLDASKAVNGRSFALRNVWPFGLAPIGGFYPIEHWGCWIGAEAAGLLLRFHEVRTGTLHITIFYQSYCLPGGEPGKFSLVADGVACRVIATESKSDAITSTTFSTGPATFGTTGQIFLLLQIQGGGVPAENGVGDPRHLSVGLTDLSWSFTDELVFCD